MGIVSDRVTELLVGLLVVVAGGGITLKQPGHVVSHSPEPKQPNPKGQVDAYCGHEQLVEHVQKPLLIVTTHSK